MPSLVIERPGRGAESFSWASGCVGIGADPRNDVVLAGSRAAPFHAALIPVALGAWRLRDLSSADGIAVNGERTLEALLAGRATIEVAGSRLAFEPGAPPATVQPIEDKVALARGAQAEALDAAGAERAGLPRGLFDALLALGSEQGTGALLGATVSAIAALAGASYVFAGRFEGEDRLEVAAAAGPAASGMRLRTSRTLIARARAERTAIVVRPREAAGGSMEGLRIVAAVCVPLLERGEPRGVVCADWREDAGPPSPERLGAAGALALFAAARWEGAAETERLSGALERVLPGRIEPVGISRTLRALVARLDQLARTDASVLLAGETGTGKGFFAERMHLRSPRRDGPFVATNCAALPRELFESELFGHRRGAFTGAAGDRDGLFHRAHKGTLFLDELGEMPLDQQAKLLHVMQSGAYRPVGADGDVRADARVIAGTNADVRDPGVLRPDLLNRFDVSALRVPALRERAEDVPLLAHAFLDRETAAAGRPALALEPDVLAAMAAYGWPGNVRELEKAVRTAVLLSDPDRGTLSLEDFELSRIAAPASGPPAPAPGSGDAAPLEAVERAHIARVLLATGGNQRRACEILGISPNTMTRKKRLYDL